MNRSSGLIGSARVPPLLLALCAVLPIAGCGGGASTTASSSASSPTRSVSPQVKALIVAADAICRRLNSRVVVSLAVRRQDIASAASQNAVLEQAALAELERLSPPESIAGQWQQVLAYRRTLARQLPALARYERSNDAKAATALIASKRRLHRQLRVAALRLGTIACA